ncbi:MAG: hypothetical protein F4Z01_07575 [Gammaproteobacteria bacterium]|nr:hypothetical protein [Gammaproteobacteria bacterium]MYF38923.1 hypothetical protein [Gammaproteobacteria bacterium]
MKTLRKLLAGMVLITLTAFGLTALTSSSSNTVVPVVAFLNHTCSSDVYMEHESIQAMLEFNGTTRDGIVWDFESYHHIEDLQTQLYPVCYLVSAIEEVVVRGTPWPARPSDPYGAQGGRTGTPTPTPQEPEPPTPPAQLQADNFTEEKSNDLRECLEEDLGDVSEEIEGWNSDAIGATEAEWGINKNVARGFGYTGVDIGEDNNGNPTLSIGVFIYPQGIANAVAAMFVEQRDVQVAAFEQLTQFTQAHELFHVGQLKTIFEETGARPKPYQYWDLEVQAHNGSTSLWQGIHGDNAEPPSTLNLGSQVNFWRKAAYDLDTARYKELEVKKENGTITSDEETEMDELEATLKDPSSLPEANANRDWDPDAIDIDCE